MPSPRSISPKTFRFRRRRRFTVEQANSTLPLVKKIATDVVRTHREALNMQVMLANPGLSGQQQHQLEALLDKLLSRMHDYMDELKEIGCELKDPRVGMVDFAHEHDGREVYLCWKLGEERVEYFHELNEGAAGRQPIGRLF